MTIQTDAPHWSIWSIDGRMADLTLPDEPINPRGEWRGRWELSETVASRRRRQITGHLEIHHIPDGRLARLEITQRIPGVQGMSVTTETSLECRNDDWLSPMNWVSEFMSHSGRSNMANTQATQRGLVSRSSLLLSGVDETRTPLPRRTSLTSNFSLISALPRLAATGEERLDFTLLEDLMIVRNEQRIERIDAVQLPTATGPVSVV